MLNFFRLKGIDEFDLDDPRRTLHHRKIIESKAFLKRLYLEWYSELAKWTKDIPAGSMLELGSGGGFMREVIADIKTSDIMEFESNDYTFNALQMPFEDNSLSAILMVDVFHHVPDSQQLISEMMRCLKPGGRIIMSEPCTTWWSKFIFKNFHHEPFNEKGDWSIPGTGPMSDANGALPWIVFERDRDKLLALFPNLKIKSIEKHSPLRYLLSGGVSMKQLAPSWSFGLLKFTEKIIQKVIPSFAMFQYIVLEKS